MKGRLLFCSSRSVYPRRTIPREIFVEPFRCYHPRSLLFREIASSDEPDAWGLASLTHESEASWVWARLPWGLIGSCSAGNHMCRRIAGIQNAKAKLLLWLRPWLLQGTPCLLMRPHYLMRWKVLRPHSYEVITFLWGLISCSSLTARCIESRASLRFYTTC